jgi:hypothetical protein
MHLVALAIAEDIAVLLERAADELGLLPEVRSEEPVGVGDGNEGGLEGVLQGLGRSGRGSVDVVNTSQLQQTLDGGRSDETSTTRSRDKSDGNGTTLAALLDGDGVRLTEVGTPVTTTDRNNAELGNDDGSTDSSSDFLGGLDSETDVTLAVADDDDGLESGALTGTGLLLDRLDLWRKPY